MKDLSQFFCESCRGQLRGLKRGEGACCVHHGVSVACGRHGLTIHFAPGRGPLGQTLTRLDKGGHA